MVRNRWTYSVEPVRRTRSRCVGVTWADSRSAASEVVCLKGKLNAISARR